MEASGSSPTPSEGTLFVRAMCAGAVAGLMEHSVMFPVDTIKTRLQVKTAGAPMYAGTIDAFGTVLRTEGYSRLWRGLGASASAAIPSHAVYFAVYEAVRRVLGAASSEHRPFETAIAGGLGMIAHDAVSTPADVVKQRMQLYRSSYPNTWSCASSVYAKEGLRAFFVSFPTTVVMNLPYTTVHFVAYESLKRFLHGETEANSTVEHIQHFCAGGIAGMCAAFVCTPLDVVKTHLQTQGSIGMVFSGFRDAALYVFRSYGLRGFLRGTGARMMYAAPGAAISWMTYEWAKKLFGIPPDFELVEV